MDVSLGVDGVEVACKVIAGRLEVDPETAAQILERVARREGLSTRELASDVLASCANPYVRLPYGLSTIGDGYRPAA